MFIHKMKLFFLLLPFSMMMLLLGPLSTVVAMATRSSVQQQQRQQRRLQEVPTITTIPILMQVQGKPGLLYPSQHFDILESEFMDAYNTAQASRNCPGVITNVTLDGFEYVGSGLVSRTFTIQGLVTISGTSSLFSIASRRRRRIFEAQEDLEDSSSSSTRPRRTNYGNNGKGKGGGSVPAASSEPPPSPSSQPIASSSASATRPTAGPTPCNGNEESNTIETTATSTTTTTTACLTQELFLLDYNNAVLAQTDALNSSVELIISVTEMTPSTESCPTEEERSQIILVEFVGNASLATDEQDEALAQALQQTYNAINQDNPETCDPQFQQVLDVELVQKKQVVRRRNLQQSSNAWSDLGTSFAYFFKVNSTCQSCSSNLRLFGEGSGRRRQLNSSSEFFDCTCPVGATELRAPTEEEFVASYTETIQILHQENVIDPNFVGYVANITAEVDCEMEEGWFATEVFMEISGTHQQVTTDEMLQLATSFYDAHDLVSQGLCDPHQRSIARVEISTSITGGGGEELSGSTTSTDFDWLYTATITVKCHGCSDDPSPMLFSESTEDDDLTGDGDDSCYCTFFPGSKRGPTAQEFEVVFNEVIQDLQLGNIHQVVDVLE